MASRKSVIAVAAAIFFSAGSVYAQGCDNGVCWHEFDDWSVRVKASDVLAAVAAKDGARVAYGCFLKSPPCTWAVYSPPADCKPGSQQTLSIESNGWPRPIQAKCEKPHSDVDGRIYLLTGDLAELSNLFFATDVTIRLKTSGGQAVAHTFSGNGSDLALTSAYRSFAKLREIQRSKQ